MVNLPLLIPPSNDDFIIRHPQQILSHHWGLHPNRRPTQVRQPPRSMQGPPTNISFDSPHPLEICKNRQPRPSQRNLQESTRGDSLVRREQQPPSTSTTHRSREIPKRGSNKNSRHFGTLALTTNIASEPRSTDVVFSSFTPYRKCTIYTSATKTPTTK